jgi:sugar/nucleoside kinase (ribokinase family)
VDTTGAGDCFAAGFLAGLVRGDALRESGRLWRAAGALSVSPGCAVFGVRGRGSGYHRRRDCFAAGFLAGLVRGDALRESARLGCAAGALSVSRVGAVTAISPEEFTRFWERVATAGGTKDRQR